MRPIRSCWEALGLPDPQKTPFSNFALAGLYRRFCSRMRWLDGRGAIKTDGELLDDNSEAAITLVQALIHPSRSQLSTLFNLCEDEKLEIPHVEDYRLIVGSRRRGKDLIWLDAEMSDSSPGGCGGHQICVTRFKYNWAIVLFTYDGNDLPIILGFSKLNRLRRNVASVVGAEDMYINPSPDEREQLWPGSGEDLILACWTRHDDCNYSGFFLQFADSELDVLRQRYRSLANPELLDAALNIASTSGIDVNSFAKHFGRPSAPDYLDRIQAMLDQKEEEEAEEAKRREQRLYEQALIRDPKSFRHDMCVNELSTNGLRSLKKWMQETLGLKDVVLEMRENKGLFCHKSGFSFIISYRGVEGWKRHEFDEPYPTIMEAFTKAIPGYKKSIQ